MPKKSVEDHTPLTLLRIHERVRRANVALEAVAKTMTESDVKVMPVQCHAEMVRALAKLELFVHEAGRSLHQTLEEQGWFTRKPESDDITRKPSTPPSPKRRRA